LRKQTLVVVFTAVLAAGCTVADAPNAVDVATWRAEKDRFMRSAESPVPAEQRRDFPPLEYFAIDPGYSVPASLAVAPGTDILELSTSGGLRRKMRKIGTLQFTLKDQPLTLTAFVDAGTNDVRRLFVPFGDLTNGSETYPGGRYLDLERTGTGFYEVDFNRAYNPYCVYNVSYDCPVPPPENRLSIAVRAGERMPAQSGD
jgi:uncharacterized protein (DUF1684 family)